MTTHSMGLNPGPFEAIRSGAKTIELRLYDEKRRRIRPGDRIVFTDTADESRTLPAEVRELLVFPSFEELYAALPLTACGYSEAELPGASPRDMEVYYSPEQQRRYGVVGIVLAPLSAEQG